MCTTLNYSEQFLTLGSSITGGVSISAFTSLVGIPIGITTSAIELRMCAITAVIKNICQWLGKRKRSTIK